MLGAEDKTLTLETFMEKFLTAGEAFDAMGIFLNYYNDRGGGKDELIHVLHDISTTVWLDGGPYDPAQWHDWLRAVNEVIAVRKLI